jgi:hypothetical protein
VGYCYLNLLKQTEIIDLLFLNYHKTKAYRAFVLESPCNSVTVSTCRWVKRFQLTPLCSKENLDAGVILQSLFFHFVAKIKFLILPETKFRVTELPQATLTYSVNRRGRVQRKLSLSVSGLLVWVFDLSG